MTLPAALVAAIDRAGYFPEATTRAVERALGTSPLRAWLVRPETTFDGPEVRRHLTVLLVTHVHLFIVHVDEAPADSLNPSQVMLSMERVRLERIHNLGFSEVFDSEGQGASRDRAEVTLAFAWGAQRRVELERAWCDDPQCEVDHGMAGTVQPSDLVLRISALADGRDAVTEAVEFFDVMLAVTE